MEESLETFNKCDIFTPDEISLLMSNKLSTNSISLLEPSVGTGNLLKYINLNNYEIIDVYELKTNYLDEILDERINKHNCDFLKAEINQKYDSIILNPPYIRIQDLPKSYRTFLREEFQLNGNLDIYYAFIIKCLNLLSEKWNNGCYNTK